MTRRPADPIRLSVSTSGSSRSRSCPPARSSTTPGTWKLLSGNCADCSGRPRAGQVRTGPDKRTKSKPSNRWRKTQARIAKLRAKVSNARRDGLHKLSTRLVREHGAIVLEDLNVRGMLSNRKLARHVAGVGMAELRRQIEYKATWSGAHVHVADRWYPSSKTCSECGAVKTKLRLSERTYTCEHCGMVLDRDLNAARNLAALVERETSSASCAVRLNEPDGNPRKTTPGGSGYRHGKTRTPNGAGQRRHREVTTQDTLLHVS